MFKQFKILFRKYILFKKKLNLCNVHTILFFKIILQEDPINYTETENYTGKLESFVIISTNAKSCFPMNLLHYRQATEPPNPITDE